MDENDNKGFNFVPEYPGKQNVARKRDDLFNGRNKLVRLMPHLQLPLEDLSVSDIESDVFEDDTTAAADAVEDMQDDTTTTTLIKESELAHRDGGPGDCGCIHSIHVRCPTPEYDMEDMENWTWTKPPSPVVQDVPVQSEFNAGAANSPQDVGKDDDSSSDANKPIDELLTEQGGFMVYTPKKKTVVITECRPTTPVDEKTRQLCIKRSKKLYEFHLVKRLMEMIDKKEYREMLLEYGLSPEEYLEYTGEDRKTKLFAEFNIDPREFELQMGDDGNDDDDDGAGATSFPDSYGSYSNYMVNKKGEFTKDEDETQ